MIFSSLRTQIRHFAKQCPEARRSCPPPRKPQPKFTKCLRGPSGVYPIKDGGYKLWRNITFLVCFPLIFGVAFKTFSNTEEKERAEFHKYEYMRIRTKTFPWGTNYTFFHNPRLNALPDGYED